MIKECDVCKSPVFDGQERGSCNRCQVRTCVQCIRFCDGCTKISCWNHISVEKVWMQGHMQLMKLCDNCKETKRWE